jgi:hypothetical protein
MNFRNMSVGQGSYGLILLGSLLIVAVVFALGLSIAGSYLLMVHYVHVQNVALIHAQAKATAAAKAAQLKSAVGTCKAVKAMDAASHGATNASSSASSYGHKLALAIHNLYVNSGCPALLKGIIPKTPGL